MADDNLTVPDPIKHENSRLYLRDRHVSLLYKLNTVKRGLAALAPEAYQYAQQGEEAFLKAMTEHGRRLYKLRAVYEELQTIINAIDPETR